MKFFIGIPFWASCSVFVLAAAIAPALATNVDHEDYDGAVSSTNHVANLRGVTDRLLKASYVIDREGRQELNDFGSEAHTLPGLLGLCEGDCDRDDHCAAGLVCFQRSKGDPVPGCTGNLGSNSDFCVPTADFDTKKLTGVSA
mmetsp:Transcript_11439/g.32835  ORF Transcript_11439/g.32835 Transcript_11439/m.32835 type:complete len:143 (-) Transcript_11439:200-628(-)|eukprot:CAMPEP_0119561012 /NCGR_PEP_ID=MMETSP1352-20130426/16428_1 /TAXON_ID=265584 /ORGANISM="Stauroneis constricta, Strain CCMP1120" /LENGTH=142 /DNA_ID=CAMNT_0007609111 /DNA_START=141 /DNA_END=569 /DNA_ORIENTATION=+